MDLGTIVAAMDSAMVIVTAASGHQRSGCLVGFHSQSSIDPLRYCVWISTANHTHGVAAASTHLVVHVLDQADAELAELFGATTGDDVDKFAHCDWHPGPGGVPVLDQCRGGIVGRRLTTLHGGGDHDGFVIAPDELWMTGPLTGPVAPLRLGQVLDLAPGHPVSEH